MAKKQAFPVSLAFPFPFAIGKETGRKAKLIKKNGVLLPPTLFLERG